MKSLRNLFLLTIALAATLLGGCAPYMAPKFEEIESNQTAFLVPLEGATKEGQKQFGSLEYLESAKVPAKRIDIPQRKVKTGRMWWQVRYLPTMRVVKVDRTPQSREWSATSGTGTSDKDQAFRAESKESIGFQTEITCAATVEETNAARFLYYYAGKPLTEIMDQELRNRLQKVFATECSKRTIEQIRGDKAAIIAAMEKDAQETFKARGITITNVGWSGEFSYAQPEIQQAINARFVAQQQLAAQREVNQRMMMEAEAIRQLASAGGAEYQLRKRSLDLREKELENQAALIGKLQNPTLPQVWGGGNLLGLDLKQSK